MAVVFDRKGNESDVGVEVVAVRRVVRDLLRRWFIAPIEVFDVVVEVLDSVSELIFTV